LLGIEPLNPLITGIYSVAGLIYKPVVKGIEKGFIGAAVGFAEGLNGVKDHVKDRSWKWYVYFTSD
jgi:hypothetical protein